MISFRAPSKVKEEDATRDAFIALSSMFAVFPSPQGCERHGAKVSFNKTLDAISDAMGMRRPRTELLDEDKKPPFGFVLKREFSDEGRDVYIPKLRPGEPERKETRRAVEFLKKREASMKNKHCSWLAQELVPFLAVAEIRFICVDGIPIRNIVTGKHPDDHPTGPGELWCYENNDSLRTLSELQ